MKFRDKFVSIGLGAAQFLASACAIPPAFTLDLVRYMWQNRSSPFKESDDKNDPPLETPLTEKMIASRNKGMHRIAQAVEPNISKERQKTLAEKYSNVISFGARLLLMGLITGLSVAGAIATFPAGTIVLSVLIAAGSYGVINAGKKLTRTLGEIKAERGKIDMPPVVSPEQQVERPVHQAKQARGRSTSPSPKKPLQRRKAARYVGSAIKRS